MTFCELQDSKKVIITPKMTLKGNIWISANRWNRLNVCANEIKSTDQPN